MLRVFKKIVPSLKRPQVFFLIILFTGFLAFSLISLKGTDKFKGSEILVDTEFGGNQKSGGKSIGSSVQPEPTIPDNYADMSSPVQELYNLQEFLVFSPLFEGKTVEKIESKYKGALIISRYISADDIRTSVWTIEKQAEVDKIDLPTLPQRLIPKHLQQGNYYDFPILDGYEWGFVIVDEKFISHRIPDNVTQDELYYTKEGLTFYRGTMWCPRSTCGVKLVSLIYTQKGERQVFITLSKAIDNYITDEKELDKQLQVAYRDIELFADTLSVE